MGKPKHRFVAKAEAKKGWRIWDNKQKKWWGQTDEMFPANLLSELNGDKRSEQLVELLKQTPRKRIPRT